MDRDDVHKSFRRRMLREAKVLRTLFKICEEKNVELSDATTSAQRVLDRTMFNEWTRSVKRVSKSLGQTIELTSSRRLQRVKEVHRISSVEVSSATHLASRSRMLAIGAITCARAAGALDVVDALHEEFRIEATAKKKKKKKAKRKKRLTKEWVTEGDSRVCEECDELDGVVVNAYSDFRLDPDLHPHAYDYHGDSIEGPLLHPACRCELLISRA
jgi:hypothetical protein